VRHIEETMGLWDKRRNCSRIVGPADNQLWEKRGEHLTRSKADDFAERGIGWVKADKKSRQRNAELLAERLRDHMGGTTTPGIVFFRTCRKTIETIPSIQRKPPPNDEEPADGGDDHWLDETLYACAYASRGRVGVASGQGEDDVDEDFWPPKEAPVAKPGAWGYG
jgi:hypothetical protein